MRRPGCFARAAFGARALEISWSQLAFDDAGHLQNPREWEVKLRALRRHGLRPLVLLNANHQAPTPVRQDKVLLTDDAPAGARTVTLAAQSRTMVRPGRTGFGGLGSDRAADVLITDLSADGRARLSKPLPAALSRGERDVTTLTHPPFGVPGTAGFERTLKGWLRYVGTVTRFVHEHYGSWDFDVEVWNELTFGSDFLRPQAYFDPAPKERATTRRSAASSCAAPPIGCATRTTTSARSASATASPTRRRSPQARAAHPG